MTVREKMIAWREENDIELKTLSINSGISETLLSFVESGQVTHPEIAKKIGKIYNLSENEIYELMPKNYRPETYEPDKYADLRDKIHMRICPTIVDEAQAYLIDQCVKQRTKRHKAKKAARRKS